LNKKLLLFFISFLILTNLFPKQTKLIGNYIKLAVSNENGSFVVYGRNNVNDEWTPLVFEDENPTSYFRFFKKDQRIPFGEGGSGRYSEIDIQGNKVIYYWQDPSIKINLNYQLASSNDSRSADTLVIDVNIENKSLDPYDISFFLCIDTYIGEKTRNNFIMPGNYILQNETEIPKSAPVSNILTYDDKKKIGVNIVFEKDKQITPDRVFFANWKRVDESISSFKVKEGRNFNLEPYSINDSSVFIDYKVQKIYPNRDHIYRFILSMKGDVNLNIDNKDNEKTNIIKESKAKVKESAKHINVINFNLSELLALLEKINKKLESGEELSEEDINLSNNILDEIRKRKNK